MECQVNHENSRFRSLMAAQLNTAVGERPAKDPPQTMAPTPTSPPEGLTAVADTEAAGQGL